MVEKTLNFLGLAIDDYRAARMLLREGLLTQGATIAATSVEKELRAILALKGVFSRKEHLDPALFAKIRRHYPDLSANISEDFIRFLGKAFKLRYAAVDSAGFNLVINQNRTLIQLDATILTIDSGLQVTVNGKPQDTPLQTAIKSKDPLILQDNVPLGVLTLEQLAERPNKMLEILL